MYGLCEYRISQLARHKPVVGRFVSTKLWFVKKDGTNDKKNVFAVCIAKIINTERCVTA